MVGTQYAVVDVHLHAETNGVPIRVQVIAEESGGAEITGIQAVYMFVTFVAAAVHLEENRPNGICACRFCQKIAESSLADIHEKVLIFLVPAVVIPVSGHLFVAVGVEERRAVGHIDIHIFRIEGMLQKRCDTAFAHAAHHPFAFQHFLQPFEQVMEIGSGFFRTQWVQILPAVDRRGVLEIAVLDTDVVGIIAVRYLHGAVSPADVVYGVRGIEHTFHDGIAGGIHMVDSRCGIALGVHGYQYAQWELRTVGVGVYQRLVVVEHIRAVPGSRRMGVIIPRGINQAFVLTA